MLSAGRFHTCCRSDILHSARYDALTVEASERADWQVEKNEHVQYKLSSLSMLLAGGTVMRFGTRFHFALGCTYKMQKFRHGLNSPFVLPLLTTG